MCIKLVVVPSEKPVPQRPDQNEQGQRVRYGLLYIIVKQITETFLIFYRGPNIVRPEPESVFAVNQGKYEMNIVSLLWFDVFFETITFIYFVGASTSSAIHEGRIV